MSLDSPWAVRARRVTRGFRPLYRALSRWHHAFLKRSEWWRLRRAYPGLDRIEYPPPALLAFRKQGYRSQFGQDHYLVSSGLVGEHGGRFVEIGCNHPERDSNSYYLEIRLGFRGLAIDPLGEFAVEWAKERPGSVFVQGFVSARESPVKFARTSGTAGWESMLSGAAESVNVAGKPVEVRVEEVDPQRLDRILQEQGWGFDVDVMFVDVEGHEDEVLRSATWRDGRPRVIVIENTGPWTRQQALRRQLEELGYALVARISIYDDVYVRMNVEGAV